MTALAAQRRPGPYPYGLTKRQMVVAKLISAGHLQKQIAAELGITRRAVAYDSRELRLKMRVDTTAQAVALLAKRGLV